MILEIIVHTPLWVFMLFAFLLFLSFMQTKDRKISLKRVFLLALIMLLLSFLGMVSAFGINFSNLAMYLVALFLGIFLNIKLNLPRGSRYLEEEKLFFIKGSFIPFILIMGIFFTKYFVGVVTAKELLIVQSMYFSLTISYLYGFFSGVFFGRVFVLKKILKLSV